MNKKTEDKKATDNLKTEPAKINKVEKLSTFKKKKKLKET